MRFYLFSSVLILGLLCGTTAMGQHADIEFGYDDLNSPTGFTIEGQNTTTDGKLIYEAAMEPDAFNPNDFGSDEPGFVTNATENLFVADNDRIFLEVLNASAHSPFGVGFVNFFSESSMSMQAASASRRLLAAQNTGSLTDLTFNGLALEGGNNPVFLGAGGVVGGIGNSLHDHIAFDLLDDATAPEGAYGVLFRLQADRAINGFGSMDFSSDPFWIVWNHGMTTEDFDSKALPAFGAVPEPGTMLLLGMVSLGMLSQRRRKS